MSIIVAHDKRRYEILEKALDVFIEEGFEDATYQKIADKCSITRTTLYLYFKNKREVFNFSIKQFLETLEHDIIAIREKKEYTHTEKLFKVISIIIERLEENRRLLLVILDYLTHASKGDYDPDYRVRRRTVRLRHILATMLIEGIKAGEFSAALNVKDANELLYSFFEATVFRLVVLRRTSVEELKRAVRLAIHCFREKD